MSGATPEQTATVSEPPIPISFGQPHAKVAPAPQPESIHAVTQLVDNPKDWLDSSDRHSVQWTFAPQTTRMEKAEELQLTIHDFLPYFEDIQESYGTNALSKVQEFAGLYGVTVRPADPQLEPHSTPTGTKTLQTIQSANNLIAIGFGLQQLPVEHVQDIGLTDIVLEQDPPYGDRLDYYGTAITGEGNHKVQFNFSTQFFQETVLHEFGHTADTAYAGSPEAAGNDPSFTASNSDVDIYNHRSGNIGPYVSAEAFKRTAEEMTKAGMPENTTQRCDMDPEYSATKSKIEVPTDYSLDEVWEDKAEELVEIYEGNYSSFDPASPILRSKQLNLLARMYEMNRSVAEYFAFLTTRTRQYFTSC